MRGGDPAIFGPSQTKNNNEGILCSETFKIVSAGLPCSTLLCCRAWWAYAKASPRMAVDRLSPVFWLRLPLGAVGCFCVGSRVCRRTIFAE